MSPDVAPDRSGTFVAVSTTANSPPSYELTCPHCRRDVTAELIDGSADRYRGFKCPHCRLFVPFERAEEPEPAQ